MKENLKDRMKKLSNDKKAALIILLLLTVFFLWWAWLIVGVLALFVWLIRKIVKTRFFKKYKKVIFIALAGFIVFSYISNQQTLRTERNRDYYINTVESVTFDCNASYDSSSDSIDCESQSLTGEFSKYDTVEVEFASMNGNEFTQSVYTSIPYESNDFDIATLENGLTESERITLHNKVLNETVSEAVVKINYNIDEQDLSLIKQKHQEWKIAEKKRKAQEAADKKAQEKAAKAEDERKDREATDKAEQQQQEPDSQDDYKMPDDIHPYEIKALCERYAESKGYPNAEIKTMSMQGTDMENGKYYKVSGTLYIDEGWTSAERSVGTYACTADYNDWYVTSAFLNRKSM